MVSLSTLLGVWAKGTNLFLMRRLVGRRAKWEEGTVSGELH